ncbi:glycolipid transfer protein domain-containing protein [Chytriomyces sp. MP71]|nr:glycolipid transfer protein domain-containing protein [Chytriomyces sp. MP71]
MATTASIFDRIPSFSTVAVAANENNAIDVPSFLAACQGLCSVFDLLGTAFSVIKSDIQGNITKIDTKAKEGPQFNTLQAILLSEVTQKKRTAAEGLLWLKRTLDLTNTALKRNWADPTEELSVSFNKAYETTLSPFHSFIVRPVFSMAMKACPTRADFYAKLGVESDASKAQFVEWLGGLDKVVTILNELYIKEGVDKDIWARK